MHSTKFINISILTTASTLMLVAATGCAPPPPKKGLYINCDGVMAGNTYETFTGLELHSVHVCLGPEDYYGSGGADEVGSDDVSLANWVNDDDDLEFLQTECAAACADLDTKYGGMLCNVGDWAIQNYEYIDVPSDWELVSDPSHLSCDPLPLPMKDGWETPILNTGSSPTWPSNSSAISVDCTNFEDCRGEFDAPLNEVMFYDDNSIPWGEDMGYGDHLATSTSSSTLAITFVNPGGAPSSDSNDAGGRVEYSASDCGDTACPFYLANLTLSNTADTWSLYSEDLLENVYITNITAQLRRPTLGIWKTATGEFYIDDERLQIYITGTVQIGRFGLPSVSTYLVTNVDGIYGEIGAGGEIEILDFAADDGGNFELEADLIYDSLDGSPPTANHGMGVTVVAPSGAGLPIAILADLSSDPDNDIDIKYWFVDGVKRVAPYVIPTGPHTIGLAVLDERGALDLHESTVLVLAP